MVANANKNRSDELSPAQRAEDVLLGGLGFGEEARIVWIQRLGDGFVGLVVFPDGEEVSIENDEPLSALEQWAVDIIHPLRKRIP